LRGKSFQPFSLFYKENPHFMTQKTITQPKQYATDAIEKHLKAKLSKNNRLFLALHKNQWCDLPH